MEGGAAGDSGGEVKVFGYVALVAGDAEGSVVVSCDEDDVLETGGDALEFREA